MPTFTYTCSTGSMTQSGGTVSVAIPLEGTAEGFGSVFGTLHSHNVGKPSGTYDSIKGEGVLSLTERTWSGTFG